MDFVKKNWQFRDIISENELNRMEDGIEEGITKAEQADQKAQQAQQTANQTASDLATHLAEKATDAVRPHGMGRIASQDYESGTWTPSLLHGSGAVYSKAEGNYTKIGKKVFIECVLELSNKSSSEGAVAITSLPFLIATTSQNGKAIFNVSARGLVAPTACQALALDEWYITIVKSDANGNLYEALQNSDLTNTSSIRLSGSYTTN